MASFYGIMKPQDVVDAKTFAIYAQQKLGTPYPTTQGMIALKKNIKNLFATYEYADYQTLVKLVEWARSKKKRYADTFGLVAHFRYAWRDGYLPELDPNPTREIDALIEKALRTEQDQEWRRRLVLSQGVEARTAIYKAWCAKEAEQRDVSV